MRPPLKFFLLFLLFNFGGLALGSYLQGSIADNEWYASLNRAPWMPPGWAFGAAWFSIMLAYSYYLSQLTVTISHRFISFLFVVSWVFNVAWSPLFFRFHATQFALVVLALLFLCILTFFLLFGRKMRVLSFLLLPYLVWLGIAFSLNWYVIFNN
ncbi:tryptophan-rich sensory protein [Vicingaceae bacterium]|nr:tryptophan-rich sensory protein [Vicingaceae bacterium]MDB4061459.1 tryptophan-rich sensory protein [Vicingaceae bacterium]MDC1451279.1 tryptophan-rich sensory protein [Vicingaceae bacterium]